MSQHQCEVATWVAMARLGLMSRHHFNVATWAAVWAGETMSRHRFGCRDMILAALMSRHRSEVATWGRLSDAVQCFVHCLGNCSWTLFMNTVHRDLLKKKYIYIKTLKIFLCMIYCM